MYYCQISQPFIYVVKQGTITMQTNQEIARLLPIQSVTLGDEAHAQTVNARDLHTFLGVGKVFRAWIQDRIQQFGFVENQDFVCFEDLSRPNLDASKSRQQKTKEYALTIDMAKELSMVERTPKGKEARQYFIACEKALYSIHQRPRAGGLPDIDPKEVQRVARTARLVQSYAQVFKGMGMTLPTLRSAIISTMLDCHGVDLRKIVPRMDDREPQPCGLQDSAAFFQGLCAARLPTGETVGEAISASSLSDSPGFTKNLSKVGLAVKIQSSAHHLVIAVRHRGLAALLRGTPWHVDGAWGAAIEKVHGIQKKTVRLQTSVTKAYVVPLRVLPFDWAQGR
jgi:phage anti-repressor protein